MTTAPFSYDALGGRVVFGPGARKQIADEVERLMVEMIDAAR